MRNLNYPSLKVSICASLLWVVTSQSHAIIDGQLYSDPSVGLFPPDGISDLWQNIYRIDPFWPVGHPLHVDSDLDGDLLSNIDEYSAGTDPTDRESFLSSELIFAAPDSYSLQLNLRAGREYTLQSTADLTGSFANVETMAARSSQQSFLWPLTPTDPSQFFWRVDVSADADTDGDDILDLEEEILETNPILRDSDFDNIDDNIEIFNGSDPTDRSDTKRRTTLFTSTPSARSRLIAFAEEDPMATDPTIRVDLERLGDPNQFLTGGTSPIIFPGGQVFVEAVLPARRVDYRYTSTFFNLTEPRDLRYRYVLPHEFQGGTTATVVDFVTPPTEIEQIPGLIPPTFVASIEGESTLDVCLSSVILESNLSVTGAGAGLPSPSAPANEPLMEAQATREQTAFSLNALTQVRFDLPAALDFTNGIITLMRSSTDFEVFTGDAGTTSVFSGSALSRSWDLSNASQRSGFLGILYPPSGVPSNSVLQKSFRVRGTVESEAFHDEALSLRFSYPSFSTWNATNGAFDPFSLFFDSATRSAIKTLDLSFFEFDITGFTPGSSGIAVAEDDEDDPDNITLMVNDSFDEGLMDNGSPIPDFSNDSINTALDQDYIMVTLSLSDNLTSGIVDLLSRDLSNGDIFTADSFLNLFSADGSTQLTPSDFSIDVSSPSGALASLVTSGSVTLLAEAKQTLPNGLALFLGYTDAIGAIRLSDEVRVQLLQMDLEASEFATVSPLIGASASTSIPLPFQLNELEEEVRGIKLGVNNDDDDRSGLADMSQFVDTDRDVTGDNDSASLRIRFLAVEGLNRGNFSLQLQRTSGEFASRLWKNRFDKSSSMLIAAATSGITIAPQDSNADIGIFGSTIGSSTRSWDLSNAVEKAQLLDIINNGGIIWLEGLSTGEGTVRMSFELNGSSIFEDEINVTVVESRTVSNQRVAYADSVRDVHFGDVANSDSVRNYDGGDDIVTPIAFFSGIGFRDEPSTFNEVTLSERSVLSIRMTERNLRAYVVSDITDISGGPTVAGGYANQILRQIVVTPDGSTGLFYPHEHAHILGEGHECTTDNFMWGTPECTSTPRGESTHVNQEQHDLLIFLR